MVVCVTFLRVSRLKTSMAISENEARDNFFKHFPLETLLVFSLMERNVGCTESFKEEKQYINSKYY